MKPEVRNTKTEKVNVVKIAVFIAILTFGLSLGSLLFVRAQSLSSSVDSVSIADEIDVKNQTSSVAVALQDFSTADTQVFEVSRLLRVEDKIDLLTELVKSQCGRR